MSALRPWCCLLLVSLSSGCDRTTPIVLERASVDLACPAGSVAVRRRAIEVDRPDSRHEWEAEGCGRSARYDCGSSVRNYRIHCSLIPPPYRPPPPLPVIVPPQQPEPAKPPGLP